MYLLIKKLLILLYLVLVVNTCIYAQELKPKTDSLKLYRKIESYSESNKVTRYLHRLVFKQNPSDSDKRIIQQNIPAAIDYSPFEGKIIRKILVVTMDPVGYSVYDTLNVALSALSKGINSLHVKTNKLAVKNLLLFHRNQKFDSLLVKESERLIRGQGYVKEVVISAYLPSENSDSVDVVISELDKWSIGVKASFNENRITVHLNDKNFAGLGQEFKNTGTWYYKTGEYAHIAQYYIPNILNTFIKSQLSYGKDEYGNFSKNISFDRPFYSPLTKWAAGISLDQTSWQDSLRGSDSLKFKQRFKLNIYDYWAAYAIRIFRGNSEQSRTTNLISAIRLLQTRYPERPMDIYDTLKKFSDADFYIGSVGVSARRYVHDNYIFKFGATEDVPVGSVISLTAGYLHKNNNGRAYFATRVSCGNYLPWGYLSADLQYGSFVRADEPEQGSLSAGIIYFTKLFSLGEWKFRQFVKPQLLMGFDRLPGDSLTLNEQYGIEGFNSDLLSGTSRFLLTFQSQSYAPWSILGFQFGPCLLFSVGMLGDEKHGFNNSKVYSQFGFGLLIKNDHLIFNTFQVSLAFYPQIPGRGSDILKLNSFRTTDFGYRDFIIEKPSAMVYH